MDGMKCNCSIESSCCALNTRKRSENFSLKIRTQILLSITLLLWGLAVALHLVYDFGDAKDNLVEWEIKILLANLFAAGFGWHLCKAVTLRRMEKNDTTNDSQL